MNARREKGGKMKLRDVKILFHVEFWVLVILAGMALIALADILNGPNLWVKIVFSFLFVLLLVDKLVPAVTAYVERKVRKLQD